MATDKDKKRIDERLHIDTRLHPKKDSWYLELCWRLQQDKNENYTQFFRDAFRLLESLRRRETTVLFELFPWLMDGHVNSTQLNYVNYLIERVRELEEAPQRKGK